jgi:transcription elongation factor Elf1
MYQTVSVCPHCGKVNNVQVHEGQKFVTVVCQHCTHGSEYIHVITDKE